VSLGGRFGRFREEIKPLPLPGYKPQNVQPVFTVLTVLSA